MSLAHHEEDLAMDIYRDAASENGSVGSRRHSVHLGHRRSVAPGTICAVCKEAFANFDNVALCKPCWRDDPLWKPGAAYLHPFCVRAEDGSPDFCDDCELSDCVLCGNPTNRCRLNDLLACWLCDTDGVRASCGHELWEHDPDVVLVPDAPPALRVWLCKANTAEQTPNGADSNARISRGNGFASRAPSPASGHTCLKFRADVRLVSAVLRSQGFDSITEARQYGMYEPAKHADLSVQPGKPA
jgi:hypothetical protein